VGFGSTWSRQGGLDVKRRRKRRSGLVFLLLIVVVAAGAGWWFWPRGEDATSGNPELAGSGEPAAGIPEAVIAGEGVAARDEVLTPIGVGPESESSGVDQPAEPRLADVDEPDEDQAASEANESEVLSSNPRINAALQQYQAGQILAARNELNRMLKVSRHPAEQAELRRHLKTIADGSRMTRCARRTRFSRASI
jgi:hypothetical protein